MREYGTTAICVYSLVWVSTYAVSYAVVRAGVDVGALLESVGLGGGTAGVDGGSGSDGGEGSAGVLAAGGSVALARWGVSPALLAEAALAWGLCATTGPVRALATVGLTPVAARAAGRWRRT